MWKIIEIKAGKIGVAKAKERRREGKCKEKIQKRKNNEIKESDRGMEDLG